MQQSRKSVTAKEKKNIETASIRFVPKNMLVRPKSMMIKIQKETI